MTVVTQGSISSTFAGFDIGATGSSFTMSNGTIAIQRATSNASDYLNLATTNNVTGGTLQIGNASTTASQNIKIRSTTPVYNLNVNASGTPTAQLITSALSVLNDISISTGSTLNANGIAINVGGNWNNSGFFTPGAGTVTLNGTTQSITGNTTFNNLSLSGSGTKTFSSQGIVSSTLAIGSGVVVNLGTLTTHTAGRSEERR